MYPDLPGLNDHNVSRDVLRVEVREGRNRHVADDVDVYLTREPKEDDSVVRAWGNPVNARQLDVGSTSTSSFSWA